MVVIERCQVKCPNFISFVSYNLDFMTQSEDFIYPALILPKLSFNLFEESTVDYYLIFSLFISYRS